ncbi:hypothetical protein [Chryseobacterium sp. 22458]|uniref:hypothetical protein n=1 Tax=Chryseobacterium sp. 22458 TaxID=3453921 RepID=UPI003F82FEC5
MANNIHHKFILKNPTKYDYVFYSFGSTGIDGVSIINDNKIIIEDEKNNSINEKDIFINSRNYFRSYKSDSISMNYFSSKGFHRDLYWFASNREMKKNSIFLNSKKKKIFNRDIALLVDQVKSTGSYFSLKKNKKYFIQIEIDFDSVKIKEYLTPIDLDSLKRNNIKIFHGKLKTEKILLEFD